MSAATGTSQDRCKVSNQKLYKPNSSHSVFAKLITNKDDEPQLWIYSNWSILLSNYWRTQLIHSFIKIGGGLQICKNHDLHIYPSKWEVSNLGKLKLSTLVKEKKQRKINGKKDHPVSFPIFWHHRDRMTGYFVTQLLYGNVLTVYVNFFITKLC